MGFYELGNGCDTCETISSALPTNVNMQMDTNSGLLANMSMPYGAQPNTVQQYNNTISSSGYPQGNNMGMMGNGSNGGSMGVRQQQPQQQAGANAQPKQIVKQVVTTTTTTPSNVPPAPNNIEPFTNSSGSSEYGRGTMMNPEKKWIVLGLVIFSALSLNECFKYFINKSLQLNDGSPMYYIAYTVVAILLTIAANKYASA